MTSAADTCRKKLQAYADIGIDRVMCLQIGGIPHEAVLRSIRLIGQLIPDLA